MTALWIILGIFAFFALLLALPLRIFLRYSPDDGLQYRVKYAFIPLADSQAPEKPEKQKPEKIMNISEFFFSRSSSRDAEPAQIKASFTNSDG